MAKFNARVTVDTSRLNRILRNLPGNTHDLVRAIAFAVEAQAKVNAPVDTGALRNSIYTRIGNEDGGPAAFSAAQGRNPEAQTVELPQPPSNTVAHVGPGVNYGIEVEFGGGKRAAQPFLISAVRQVERDLERRFAREARRIATDE